MRCNSKLPWQVPSPFVLGKIVIDRDRRHSHRSLIAGSKFLSMLSLSSITTPSFLSCHSFPMSFNSLLIHEALTLESTSMLDIFFIL
ncbi:hypothetical protein DAI22_11g215000 [Oryza sativa Japonica Group]|nr:hypothetical protein DAI22_11g215000 [Oryza sativa Japonica Group]